MKNLILGTALFLLPTIALAQQAQTPPSRDEIVAGCNLQLGQGLVNLGNSQHQVTELQAELLKAQKDLKEANDKLTSLPNATDGSKVSPVSPQ